MYAKGGYYSGFSNTAHLITPLAAQPYKSLESTYCERIIGLFHTLAR